MGARGRPMTEYYFDIETSDRDPKWSQVIAVAYQPIALNDPGGDLVMLKAWEIGEEGVLREALRLGVFDADPGRAFDFVPVGVNLLFDLTFLMDRMRLTRVMKWRAREVPRFLRDKPSKDLKAALVMMNAGDFKGCGLDRFTAKKKTAGHVIPGLWARRDYRAIERYIRDEAAGFFEVYGRVARALDTLGSELRVKG